MAPAATHSDSVLEQRIGHSIYTVSWIVEALTATDELYRKHHAHKKVTKVTAADTSGGKSFLSALYRCVLHFENGDPYSVVLKVPGTDSVAQAIKANADAAGDSINEISDFTKDDSNVKHWLTYHHTECIFYREFSQHLQDLPLAKVFKTVDWIYGRQQGAVLMEDLTARGSTMSFFDSFNLKQVEHIVRHVAVLHARSLQWPEQKWKGRLVRDVACLVRLGKLSIELGENLRQLAPGVFDQLIGRYAPMLLNTTYLHLVRDGIYKEVGLPTVLLHGDLWQTNIMWKLNEDGSLSNEVAAYLDWQVVHGGNPMADLARMLVLCCDAEVRREAERTLFQLYCAVVLEETTRLGNPVTFTVEQVTAAYRYPFVHQATHFLYMIPLIYNVQERKEKDASIWEARKEKVVLRAKLALEDGLAVVEADHSEWLGA
ncbi:Protein C04F6.7 [Aphelenchoides avenae]|nr:Protein C04F6.7 [Aphelenchus avenae]